MKRHLFFVLSLCIITNAFVAAEEIIVTTKSGQLRGSSEYSRNGGKIYAFKGIPYVEPPGRFEMAKQVQPWEGVKDALNYSAICIQKSGGDIVGEEDCLYLNIFYPSEEFCPHPKLLPVLLHIHGGNYEFGSGDSFGHKFVMDECIVYVSINYRLHALGFLTMNDPVLPGNLGLKDQLQALRWVNANIDNFRGSPESVTITGISAGAGSTHHFLFTPLTKGLFDKVIIQSGTAFGQIARTAGAVLNAQAFGLLMKCKGTSSIQLRDCFRALDVKDIVKNYSLVNHFQPVIEPEDAFEPIITEHPYASYKNGNFHRVPMIIGTAIDEGMPMGLAVAADPAMADLLDKNWRLLAPGLLSYADLNMTTKEKNVISDSLREFYFGDKPFGNLTIQNFSNIATDRLFYYPSTESASLHSEHAPVYQYVFSFIGNFSLLSHSLGLDYIVMSHGDDAQYLYNGQNLYAHMPEPDLSTPSGQMSINYVKLLTSFVKTGVPTDVYGRETSWVPFTDKNRVVFVMDEDTQNVVNLEKEHIDIWDQLRLREHYG